MAKTTSAHKLSVFAFASLLSATSFAAPAKPKKIAIGPVATATPAASEESIDVDQPIVRSRIESSDAPGVKVESIQEAAPVAPAATESESVPLVAGATTTEPAPTASSAPSPAPSPAPTPTPIESASPTPAPKTNVTAQQSLQWLTNGNKRFVEGAFRGDGRLPADRARTATEQKPHAIILGSSESIAVPEIIFDQGIGEISSVRVLGPSLDQTVIRSLEQAVKAYGSQLILVLGHTQSSGLEGSPYIGTKQLPANSKLEVEAALNADGIARDLIDKSPLLKAKVEAGELTIKSALYWVDTGKVKFY